MSMEPCFNLISHTHLSRLRSVSAPSGNLLSISERCSRTRRHSNQPFTGYVAAMETADCALSTGHRRQACGPDAHSPPFYCRPSNDQAAVAFVHSKTAREPAICIWLRARGTGGDSDRAPCSSRQLSSILPGRPSSSHCANVELACILTRPRACAHTAFTYKKQ